MPTPEEIIKSTKPKIEQLAQDMKTFDKTGQLEALKQYSNQLKAEGVTYTIYDDFKDIYNHTIQTANSLTTYVNTKEAKKYIKEVERFYQKKSNALDYLSELDAIIASGNTDKALVELEINKAYWEEQLNKDPDNLLVFVNSKADDTEYNAFMRLKNRVSPSKFSLQEYQKKYKIDINVFNDELEFIFEAARNISDYQTPVEYRRLLDCEDKMISNYSDINTMLAANKYRVYLSAVIFRGLGKKIQDLRKEIIEEQKRRDQEKTKTLIAEAKTKEAEGKLKTINDQIKEAETEREQLREMSNNIIKMHTSITKSQPELKVDESGDATSPDNEPKQLTDVESKIKTTPADPKLISKKQTEGFIYIRRLNKFVRIKLAKSRFKNQKPKHAILDSIGRLSGTMTDEEFQAEYAKWKVAEDDKKRGGTSDKKRAD